MCGHCSFLGCIQKRKHGLCSFFQGKLPAFVTNSSFIHFCCFIDTVFPVFCGKKNAVDRQESTVLNHKVRYE